MTKENISINAIEYGASNDVALEYEGGSTMTKTVNIEGMMCAHCEANVKKALEALDGIESAVVSHEAGTAVIELSKEVDDNLIKQTIEDKDYKFISIG
jgi:Cu2+-exporting ATPase